MIIPPTIRKGSAFVLIPLNAIHETPVRPANKKSEYVLKMTCLSFVQLLTISSSNTNEK